MLTSSTVRTFRDGSQEITIQDPNSGMQSTMGTYERGKGIRPVEMGPETRTPASQRAAEENAAKEDGNFQQTSRN